MPDYVRRQYEQAMSSFKDQDGNRIPDAIENAESAPVTVSSFKVVLDGKEFYSLDDLPPEARAKYEQAMGTLDANRNGIPDFVEGMLGGAVQQANPVSTSYESHTAHHAPRKPMPVTPTIEPDTPNVWLLALLAAFLFLACVVVAAGVWYFYLR